MNISDEVLALLGTDITNRWNLEAPLGTSVVVTYSFPSKQNSYDTPDKPGFAGFSDSHITYIEQALTTWGNASGIDFVRVPEKIGGDIQLAMFDMTGYENSVGNQVSGWGYYPQYRYTEFVDDAWLLENTHRNIGGDIFLNANFYQADANSMAPGIRGYSILIHEIGHAIGLKHPFEGDPVIDDIYDSGIYTVMSYDRSRSTTTLGTFDIEATQILYGTTDLQARWVGQYRAVEQTGTNSGEWLLGRDINDIVIAKGGNDVIRTKEGNDRIYDGFGNDTVDAGAGKDFVFAGAGKDSFDGGDGVDTLSYETARGVTVNLTTGNTGRGAKGDSVTGFEKLEGSDKGKDKLTGTDGKNTLKGNGGDDRLFGLGGRDQLDGGNGADRLFGGAGHDKLIGGAGKDRLSGDGGKDKLEGGNGADVFVFAPDFGRDTILDFEDDKDSIDLSGFGFGSVHEALDRAIQNGDDVVLKFPARTALTIRDTTIDVLADDLIV
nr:matrixin family metalloprotease [Amylibacter sp.]